jgi:hypothetical protein
VALRPVSPARGESERVRRVWERAVCHRVLDWARRNMV